MKKTIGVALALAIASGALWISRPGLAEDKEHAHGSGAPPVPASSAAEPAQPAGHSHERCELHGGQVAMTKEHHFETVFSTDGVRVYVYTREQAPMMIEKAKGTVSLVKKDGTKKDVTLLRADSAQGESAVYFCPMHPEVVQKEPGVCALCGGMKLYKQDYLLSKVDLSKVEPGSLKAVIRLSGLEGSEKEVTFASDVPATEAMLGAKPSEHGQGGADKGDDR